MDEYPEPAPVRVEGYKFEENMYIEEMRYFFEVLEGKRSITYTLEDDLRVLKLLQKVEQSEKEGKRVRMAK